VARRTPLTLEALAALPLSGRRFTTFHLDEVEGLDYDRDRPLAHVGHVMHTLARAWRDTGRHGLIRLAVPLGQVAELSTEAPSRETLDAEVDRRTPPIVYLMNDVYSALQVWAEEYRRPVAWSLVEGSLPHLTTYYSCFRSLGDREKGWEFGRLLWSDLPV
jgi:hypothetical protein